MKKILILDDDPVTLAILEKVLAGEGRVILKERDGQAGYVLTVNEKPDMVVTDLLLPHIDGFDLCRKIRSEPSLASTKIILISAVYKGFYFRKDIRESGADAFVEKPLDVDLLKNTVSGMLDDPSPAE